MEVSLICKYRFLYCLIFNLYLYIYRYLHRFVHVFYFPGDKGNIQPTVTLFISLVWTCVDAKKKTMFIQYE